METTPLTTPEDLWPRMEADDPTTVITDQELFEAVLVHMSRQKSRSMNDQRFCRYRGNNGYKCAIGALIPDSVYTPDMEGKDVDTLVPLYFPHLAVHIDLLMNLQRLHDNWTSRDNRSIRPRAKLMAYTRSLDAGFVGSLSFVEKSK